MNNANCGPALLSVGIEAREWNSCAIQRRQADGFVNATAMCRAGGKRWNHYASNARTFEYLQALSGSAGIPADLLVTSIATGPNHLRGTWIHPRLAVDLARWISPSFAVWMDGWFLEAMGVAIPAPAPQPAPLPRSQRPHGLRQDPCQHAAGYLPSLIAQRWAGDPDANGVIRAIAQHLLLSCDPLPPMAAVEGAAVAWSRQQNRRTGQYGAGTHW
jgi:hypothetical protein